MPSYIYIDKENHSTTIWHGMLEDPEIRCEICGSGMWRRPSKVAGINWGGLAPSQGEMSPEVQDLVDNFPRNREKFEERHEQHERDTAV